MEASLDGLRFGILPVVKRIARKPHWRDKWTDEQLARLVELREVKKMHWQMISHILGQKLKSCHRRYAEIVAARPPEPIVEKPRRARLHEELGIRTITSFRIDWCSSVSFRRVPITLSAGISPP